MRTRMKCVVSVITSKVQHLASLSSRSLTLPPVAINAARTRIETAWRELNAKQQERDMLIAALEALGPGDEAAALELMSVESQR